MRTPPPADLLSGRLSVRVDARGNEPAQAVNASFELLGDARDGGLNLSTPFGSTLAQARWGRGEVLLKTSQGQSRYADLDALTRDALGVELPVAALYDWLRGRPWPGAPSQPSVTPGDLGFEQLGWVVDLARFDEAWVSARREQPPAVTVRARLDRP